MNILGINFGGHDTSATIIKNGEIIAACDETSKTEEEKPEKNGQTTQCTKAKMREMIQKGLSNKEIVAACNETSKPEKKEKPKKKE